MKILWINCRLLHPVIGGDRIRTYQMLKALRSQHQITYLCLQTPADLPRAPEQAAEYCDSLEVISHHDHQRQNLNYWVRLAFEAIFSSTPLIATKYRSPAMQQRILELAEDKNFDLIICDYLAPFVNFLNTADRIKTPIVLFHHNIESLIWKRHVENSTNPIRRWLYSLQWKRTHRFEDAANRLVDAHITVSEDEARYFSQERKFSNVVGAVPTGVDFETFTPCLETREPSTLAFVGAMDWHANIDAVNYFAREVFPAVKEEFPSAKFLIIGRNPGKAVRNLAEEIPGIEFSGTVPDVLPWLHRAAAMVLPLRIGGGTRIKVYEAIAAGVPVVSTSVGVEGLDLDDTCHFRRADTTANFVSAISEILQSPAKAGAMASQALEHIRSQYNWNAVSQKFTELCEEVVSTTH